VGSKMDGNSRDGCLAGGQPLPPDGAEERRGWGRRGLLLPLAGLGAMQGRSRAPRSSQLPRGQKTRPLPIPPCLSLQVNGPGTHPVYKVLKRQQPISLPSSSGPGPGEPGRIEWK
jgi:hypothetical protein